MASDSGTTIGKAYVQIMPSTKGIKSSLESALNGSVPDGGSYGSKFGTSFASAAKKVIAAAGIGTAIKQAFSESAAFEQAVGGVETLFKENADIVKKYANEAYKTSGISANEYMEQVTSFSATLLQGLKGDTKAAAEYANVAIVDMSDNANKFGTDISSIQNAYQGFAKDNYTMLDNLKLGYGGTAEEMARLINDSGVLGDKVKVTNKTVSDVPFDKVIEAIHKIQSNLDITGTTSKEAATTFSGSFSSMNASIKNFFAALGNGEDVEKTLNEVVSTAKTFFYDNVIPMAKRMVSNIIDIVRKELKSKFPRAYEAISETFSDIKEEIEPLIDKFTEFLDINKDGKISVDDFEGAIDLLNESIALSSEVIGTVVDGIIDFVTWLTSGTESARVAKDAILLTAAAFGVLKAAMVIHEVITKVQVAFAALNAGMAANPVMTVIVALGALVTSLCYLYDNCEEFRNFVDEWKENFLIGINTIKTSWNDFKDAWALGADSIMEFCGEIKDSWDDFWDSWSVGADTITTTWDDFTRMWESGAQDIKDLVESAKEWGSDLVDNFVQGVTDKFWELEGALEDFGGTIYDYIHFTEPDKGPLANFHTFAPDMMDLFASGIKDNEDIVVDQFTASLSPLVKVGSTAAGQFEISDNGTKTSNDGLLGVLLEILMAIREGKNISVDGEALVAKLIPKIDSQLGERMKSTERGRVNA